MVDSFLDPRLAESHDDLTLSHIIPDDVLSGALSNIPGVETGVFMDEDEAAGSSEEKGKHKGKDTNKDQEKGAKQKRTRQSQSCDACRARKVKCDRAAPLGEASASTSKCTHCRQLDMDCTFDYKPRKRGPPNRYLERLQADREASKAAMEQRITPDQKPAQLQLSPYASTNNDFHMIHGFEGGPPSATPSGGQGPYRTSYSQPDNIHQIGGMPPPPVDHPSFRWETPFPTTASSSGPAASGPGPGPASASTSALTAYDPDARQYVESARTAFGSNRSMSQSQSQTQILPTTSTGTFGILDNSHAHAASLGPLDSVLPRSLLLHIVDLYFDYIFGLIPIIHRPTYMRDLQARREMQPGQEEWVQMTLALVAATLYQIPRAFVPLPRQQVKTLADTCFKKARLGQAEHSVFSFPSLQLLTTTYLLTISIAVQNPSGSAFYMGALAGLLLRNRLDEEASYEGMPVLEAELRKRIYWIVYGGDRSFASLEGSTCLIPEDRPGGTTYPMEIDDEFITENGIIDRPPGQPLSIITGFVYISKLYKICGQIISRRTADRREAPQGLMLQMRLNEVNELYNQVVELMDGCPEQLSLEGNGEARSMGGFSDDWDAQASADIRSLFLDPKASRAVVKDGYLVQQANIYVTQQMVRYLVLRYRDDLLELQRKGSSRVSDPDVPSPRIHNDMRNRRKSTNRREWRRALFGEEEKESVAADLLNILQKIPIQVIAVNSLPVVSKVRFVASTLLDALSAPSNLTQEPTPEQTRALVKTQRAQTYLWDFLRILTEIEGLYSFDDEASLFVGESAVVA